MAKVVPFAAGEGGGIPIAEYPLLLTIPVQDLGGLTIGKGLKGLVVGRR